MQSNWFSWYVLIGLHGYETEPDGVNGIGAHSAPLRNLHTLNAIGRDKLVPSFEKTNMNLDMLAHYGASMTNLVDDFITTAFTTPHVLHTLSGDYFSFTK